MTKIMILGMWSIASKFHFKDHLLKMRGKSLGVIIFSLIYILFGVLLWFLSDKLSAIMVTGENHSNEGSGIEVSDIQSVSFSVTDPGEDEEEHPDFPFITPFLKEKEKKILCP